MSDFPDLAPGTIIDGPGVINGSTTPPTSTIPGAGDVIYFFELPTKSLDAGPAVYTAGDNSPRRIVYLTDKQGVPLPISQVKSITYSTYLQGNTQPTVNAASTDILNVIDAMVGYKWQSNDLATPGTYDEIWKIVWQDDSIHQVRNAGGLIVNPAN